MSRQSSRQGQRSPISPSQNGHETQREKMMSAQPIRQILSVASILVSLLTTSATWAQNSPAESEEGGLEEIVVTAQKRAENLQEVPIAVTAVGGEAIAASGVADTRELASLIPGLAIRTTTGSFQPAIRGIGTSSMSSKIRCLSTSMASIIRSSARA